MNRHVDALPCGVRITTRDESGNETFQFIGYEDAINRLDTGDYDDLLVVDGDLPGIGTRIHCAVAAGSACGYFDLNAQRNVTMWRWLIAAAFIDEMRGENGTALVTNPDGTSSLAALYSNGGTAIPVYPLTERLAMANNIEGAMIERYGVEKGTESAVVFYRAMLDAQEGVLTPFGRETLAELHDHFISDLEANGWPEKPVAH
ncbi:hypothetical protein [Pectobacterium carotovorum]|uniref:hypothetical protein n=1 Tax=Pectobacterium carotovorum TaxID=554 RepID=UPI00202D936F|nr:hypothetical protein [Pectobacterium carotovorum]MCL6336221.1 hypothetical protein [Pectobacterium carotovorum subsp. carotovorum]MCL6349217.1 hypothetical protein [Pectobacterium carotovorum subsp. carotovorum]MCL6403702.1 hypothetical protein [Pectobacterium carotovorum subsp. carotovorum]